MSKIVTTYESGTPGTSGVNGRVEQFVTNDRKYIVQDNDGVIFNSSTVGGCLLTTSNGSNVSGTLNNTISTSLLIPSNTINTNRVVTVNSIYRTVSGTGSNRGGTIRLYLNTSSSLTGAQLIGTFTNSTITANQYTLYRQLFINNIINSTWSIAIQDVNARLLTTNVNWTGDLYLIGAIEPNDVNISLRFDRIAICF